MTWRKARLDLANFEFAIEGTDGCSAGYEFTLEWQKKFCRDVALRLVEGRDAEQLKAEMEADDAEERAAAAAASEAEMESTTTATTTTSRDTQIPNPNSSVAAKNTIYASNSALKGARASRDSSPQINNNNKRKRSRSITHATSVDVAGDEHSHAHRDEDSYRRSAAYDRDNKNGNGYSRGRWVAPLRTSWLNTSGKGIDADKWEREANDSYEPRRTRSMARTG